MVFQEGGGLPHLSVADNLALTGASRERCSAMMHAFELFPHTLGGAMSGGERRRLAVVRALLAQREWLWLDEPDAGLDIERLEDLARTLRAQADTHGLAMVVATHSVKLAGAIADRVVVLGEDGKLHEIEPDAIAAGAQAIETEVKATLDRSRDGRIDGRGQTTDAQASRTRANPVQWLLQISRSVEAVWTIVRERHARKTLAQALVLSAMKGALYYPFIGAIFGGVFVLVFIFSVPFVAAEKVLSEFGPTIVMRFSPPISAILIAACAGSTISAWVGQMAAGAPARRLDGDRCRHPSPSARADLVGSECRSDCQHRHIRDRDHGGLRRLRLHPGRYGSECRLLERMGRKQRGRRVAPCTGSRPQGCRIRDAPGGGEHRIGSRGSPLATGGGGSRHARNRVVFGSGNERRAHHTRARLRDLDRMISAGGRRKASVAVIAIAVAAWLGAVAILERQTKGSEAIVVTEPALGRGVKLGADASILWKGMNEADGECHARAADGEDEPMAKGSFSARTGPYRGYGEGLAWLRIACDGEWAGHYARKIERPLAQRRVEIARIGLDARRMNRWLNEELVPRIGKHIESLEGRSQRISLRVVLRHDVNVKFLDVDMSNARLTVDEGFAIESDLKVKFRTREIGCTWCWFNVDWIEGKGRIKAKLIVRLRGERMVVETVDLVPTISGYRSSTALPDNWDWIRRWIQSELRHAANDAKGEVEEALSRELNRQIETLRNQFGEEFAQWMTRHHAIGRIGDWAGKGDFAITRGRSHAGGERIEFSVSAAAPWLERPAPALDFKTGEHRSAVALKVSYALMNKALEVLLDRPLAELVSEAKELRAVIDELEDGLTGAGRGQRSEGLKRLARHAGQVNQILELAGMKFDTSLGFKVPIVAEPEGRDAMRIALIDAKILKGTGTPPQAWLSVSAEAKIGLVREMTASEAGHLRRHIGFEAVPGPGTTKHTAPRRYRTLAALMTAVARGERTRWHESRQDGQTAMLRDTIGALGAAARIELPVRARIGTVGLEITRIHNDHEQYAMVMSARMQH